MANTDPDGSKLNMTSHPGPFSSDHGYAALFDMEVLTGFRFADGVDVKSCWLKVDIGHEKTVIGNTMFFGLAEHIKSYLATYKMSRSLGGLNSNNFTYWVDPISGTTVFTGIKRWYEKSATAWVEPHRARTVKFEPQIYEAYNCFRFSIMFCNGMSVF